jgi:hypothetical protein
VAVWRNRNNTGIRCCQVIINRWAPAVSWAPAVKSAPSGRRSLRQLTGRTALSGADRVFGRPGGPKHAAPPPPPAVHPWRQRTHNRPSIAGFMPLHCIQLSTKYKGPQTLQLCFAMTINKSQGQVLL